MFNVRPRARVSLLGVPLDPVTADEAVRLLLGFLEGAGQRHVMTPNSEMLVEAVRNPAFHVVLQRSDLNLPDSVGLLLAARWTGQRLPERVTGVDTVARLCKSLGPEYPVFLLGARPGVAERAAAALQRANSRLHVAGTFAGSPSGRDAPEILRRIRSASPRLLLVAFGSPAQDLWIARHLADLPSVRVAMGVGGTFDFLGGKAQRAPRFLRTLGLEWLWRLIQEPRRLPRIWRAVVVFPVMVLNSSRTS